MLGESRLEQGRRYHYWMSVWLWFRNALLVVFMSCRVDTNAQYSSRVCYGRLMGRTTSCDASEKTKCVPSKAIFNESLIVCLLEACGFYTDLWSSTSNRLTMPAKKDAYLNKSWSNSGILKRFNRIERSVTF